jgi:mlo protein
MLLGFVSLLLVVFQDVIREVCIDESLMERWMPCRGVSPAARHRGIIFSIFRDGGAGARRMLGGMRASGHCSSEVLVYWIWILLRTVPFGPSCSGPSDAISP